MPPDFLTMADLERPYPLTLWLTWACQELERRGFRFEPGKCSIFLGEWWKRRQQQLVEQQTQQQRQCELMQLCAQTLATLSDEQLDALGLEPRGPTNVAASAAAL